MMTGFGSTIFTFERHDFGHLIIVDICGWNCELETLKACRGQSKVNSFPDYIHCGRYA